MQDNKTDKSVECEKCGHRYSEQYWFRCPACYPNLEANTKTYPEREQKLEIALINLIKSRFSSYVSALKWANQYRNHPQVERPLLQAIDAVENNRTGYRYLEPDKGQAIENHMATKYPNLI